MTEDTKPIDVFTFGPAWGIPVPTSSPFGVKLLTWLHLHDVPYRMHVENNPAKGPKGKCPWAVIDGETIGDSEHIIEAVARGRGIADDDGLDTHQQATATAIRLMLEDHYHQVWEHEVFVYAGGWTRGLEFFDQYPPVVRVLIRNLARRQLRQQLVARGIGRHSHAQIVEMGVKVLDAVDELLGDDPFFFGDAPTTLDACVFGFLALTKWVPSSSPVWEHFHRQPRLAAYCERMRDRFFPLDGAHAAAP